MKTLPFVAGLVLGSLLLAGTVYLAKRETSARPQEAVGASTTVTEITWEDLIPADAPPPAPPELSSDALDEFGEITDMKAVQPLAFEVNADMEGRDVRIPGFVVPLEYGPNRSVTEFLLVPYFGACLHLPPPPANQIVHVTIEKGLQTDFPYEPVWVTGRMNVELRSSEYGKTAYSLKGNRIEPYVEDP
jgi:hypothetical protein